MKFRKNNKGFSLVELIIVIAIMVALIAVMAPQFTKYIAKSRQAAFDSACEDYLSAVKSYYSDPDSTDLKETEITLTVDANKHFSATATNDMSLTAINTLAGLSSAKTMGVPTTTSSYTISVVTATGGGYTITMK